MYNSSFNFYYFSNTNDTFERLDVKKKGFQVLMSFVDHVVFLELAQCTFGSGAFGDAIISTNTSKNSLSKNFHCYAYASAVGKFFRFSNDKQKKIISPNYQNKKAFKLTQTSPFPVRAREVL